MTLTKAAALWVLIVVSLSTVAGCVVHERRDGGVTVRPMHVE